MEEQKEKSNVTPMNSRRQQPAWMSETMKVTPCALFTVSFDDSSSIRVAADSFYVAHAVAAMMCEANVISVTSDGSVVTAL